VRAGDKDHARGIISDVTILRCNATGGAAKQAAELLDPKKGKRRGPSTVGLQRDAPTFGESLLPSTRAAYAAVASGRGLTSEAIVVVFGESPFNETTVRESRLSIVDPNGVHWITDDGARHWRPSLQSVDENLREEAPALESDEPDPQPSVSEPDPGPATAAEPLYEVSDSGAVRSLFGTWVVLTAPIEGAHPGTVIGLSEGAFVVPGEEAEVVEAAHTLLALYEGHPREGDLLVETALREYAQGEGWPVRNPESVALLLESRAAEAVERNAYLASEYGFVEEAPPTNGEEEEEPETTDRMDEPEFYRDDLQAYYDLLVTTGATEAEAKAKLRQKFKVKGIVITPAGEVRAPGVVDRPNPPPPMPAAPAGSEAPLPPEEEPPPAGAAPGEKGAEGGGQAAQEAAAPLSGLEAACLGAWMRSGGPTGGPPRLLRSWSRLSGVPEAEVRRSWETATQGLTAAGGLEPYLGAAAQVKGATLPLRESEPARGTQLPFPSLDDAFLWFLTYEDEASADEFPEWVASRCPHLADTLEAWSPVDEPLHESRLDDREMYRALIAGGKGTGQRTAKRRKGAPKKHDRRCSRTMSEEKQALYDKWRRLTNVRSSALLTFLRSDVFREAQESAPRAKRSDFDLAVESARHLFRMRATPPERWTGTEWNWCGRQVKLIERLRHTGTPLVEDGKLTRKYLVLKAWGHDAGAEGRLSEEEIVGLLQTDPARAHRVIDSLPGAAPHYIGSVEEYDGRKGPRWKVLKKNQVKLTDGERDEVMRRKAVWHHGPNGAETPAVWKAVVGGKPWYVTNTHRAYNVCPSCKGAIGRYHDFIKSTA